MKIQKGFTIIELIVVIAIIAILAAIVLVNVTQYISKGNGSAIKANLSTLMTNAAVQLDTAGTYVDLDVTAASTAITAEHGTLVHFETATAFCAQSVLPAGNADTTWCVDSTGYKGTTSNCDTTNANCD